MILEKTLSAIFLLVIFLGVCFLSHAGLRRRKKLRARRRVDMKEFFKLTVERNEFERKEKILTTWKGEGAA